MVTVMSTMPVPAGAIAEIEVALLTVNEVAGVAPSSMTHRLDKLAERNLVERHRDAENRTRVLVGLTTEGSRLFTAAIQGSNVVETDLLQDLSDAERQALARLLEVVIVRLDTIAT